MGKETFGGWLAKQEKRQDQVGEVARYWASFKDEYPRVRALPSIEAAMRQKGALAAGAPTNEWWSAAIAEYRGHDGPTPQVSAVQDQPVIAEAHSAGSGNIAGPYQLTGSSSEDLDRIYRHHTGQDPPPMVQAAPSEVMALINAKLDWLHTALMSPPGSEFPPWPALASAERLPEQPMDQEQLTWDRLHELADFEATEGEA